MINNQIDNKNNIAVLNLERRKKLNVIFKKLITKKDFLHLHAISGASFLLLGTALLGCMILNDINFLEFNEIRFVNSPIFIGTILIGLVNTLTAFPLIRFSKPYHNSGDKIIKKVLKQGFLSASYFSFLLIWEIFRFSNFFPIVISFTDKLFLLPLLFLYFQGLYVMYVYIERELKDDFYVKLIFHLGFSLVLLTPLSLLPLLISGQAWVERISSLYPLETLLYTKVAFFLLLTNNIGNFGVTLLSKKIINYQVLSILNLLPSLSIFVAIFDLIKYKEEMTLNFLIGMF